MLLTAETVDVSDETGQVKLLHTKLSDYAADSMEDREVLILLRVESKSLHVVTSPGGDVTIRVSF